MDNTDHVIIRLFKLIKVERDIPKLLSELKNHPFYPSLLSISDLLADHGIASYCIKINFDDLISLQLPIIIFSISPQPAFNLVEEISGNQYKIFNKENQAIYLSEAIIKSCFGGIALLLNREETHCLNKLQINGEKLSTHILSPQKKLIWSITYMDVGASYGLPAKWEQYLHDPLFNLILVEPDKAQVRELENEYPAAHIISHALGNFNGQVQFNRASALACSSVLMPDMELLDKFPTKDAFQIITSYPLEIFRFDSIINSSNCKIPDFLKIDVQGYEFEVLEGFGSLLTEILAIELETHLFPLYKGEKTLSDITRFLNQKGFYLRHLEIAGAFEGEVMEFDAYFIRRSELILSDKQRELISFWEEINAIPPAKIFLK